MIYIGNNEISNIYVGTEEIIGIYAGDLQIYPTDIILTAISLDNLVWVTNIPASGGTATKENCNYSVIAYYSDGTTVDVTSEATITGSQVIPNTDIEEVHSAGTLTLTASYSGFTAIGNVTVYQEAAVPDFSKKLLTFIISSAGTIVWKALKTSIKRTIEYKLNDNEWTSITSKTGRTPTKINVVAGDKIQFRGNNAEYGDNTYNNTFGGSTAKFSVEGNIMSLINKTNFENETNFRGSYNLRGLFSNCTGLTSAENLILPVTTLSEGCYVGMFSGCKSLTSAPKLPATTLDYSCYNSMFEGCGSLTTAPALPATKLAQYCYVSMFQSCTSLTYAPALPATTLVIGCYKNMFYNCSKLKNIKCLATNISAKDCTYNWVSGVASTGTFVKNKNMTSWTRGNNGIPSGWIVEDNQEPLTFNILSAGTIKWTASESSASIAKTIDYKLNNGAWVSITSNAGGTAPTITVNSGDKLQFRGNNAQYATSPSSFNSFGGSASFEVEGNIMSLIYGDDFKNKLSISSTNTFYGLFRDCTNLVSAENLILPATTLAESCYGRMFYGCSSLTSAPALPATTLANYCYSSMFYGCSSLETAPELPANTLVDGCYEVMFADCSSLNYIKCLATDIYAYGCTDAWVYGVAPTGTFVKNSDMYDWTEDEQGIPAGWDIVDA